MSGIGAGGGGMVVLLSMIGDMISVGGSELPEVDMLDPVRASCWDELTDAVGD